MIIGIDPGANTGVAYFVDGKLDRLQTISPCVINEVLTGASRVIFEDSRLTSHVFTTTKNRAAALKMARNIGEVDAWCKLIVSMCAAKGIPAHGISPKAKGAKLDAEAFKKLTGWAGKSNQHERDSAMTAWAYRGVR